MNTLPPFTIARYGVYLALGAAIATVWLGTRAGYPLDQSLMRAIFTFVLVTVVAFGAEAIILTSPPRSPSNPPEPPADGEHRPDHGD
ncbi:hypothetical protein [Tepidiforma sp.]|uniref:hypothetical protein n=1 Tax=Tepidiforma sp. TaxID=2682230 RepID=UPI002ADD92CF|nr:hypothetical protein [Tepidiforma sp.]